MEELKEIIIISALIIGMMYVIYDWTDAILEDWSKRITKQK